MKVDKRSNKRKLKQPTALLPADVPSVAEGGTADARHDIAVAAYFRAEKRGFAPGGELGDWLAAEAEKASRGE